MTEDFAWNGQPVKRPCSCCGATDWYEIRSYMEGAEVIDWCSGCPQPVQVSGVPDVYIGHAGQTFQNLTDKMGRPIEIQSKRHKKQVMDSKGLIEAGDKVNGRAYGSTSWIEGSRAYRKKQFDKDRPMIRETYKQWKEKSRA